MRPRRGGRGGGGHDVSVPLRVDLEAVGGAEGGGADIAALGAAVGHLREVEVTSEGDR